MSQLLEPIAIEETQTNYQIDKAINHTVIKKSIICRNLPEYNFDSSRIYSHVPCVGDLAVFRVVKIGKHSKIQSPNGNNCYINPGDLVMLAFGNRYASNQFEGYIPKEPRRFFQILGQGGAVGILESCHSKLSLVGATEIELMYYVVDKQGQVLNTKKLYSKDKFNKETFANRKAKIILSIGSAMDSGKTTTAAFMAKGLTTQRTRVNYMKLTGTVYSKDKRMVRDFGAHEALDFSDLGYPSTYMTDTKEIMDIYQTLYNRMLELNDPEYIIIEIADGIFQRETKRLLRHQRFVNTIDHIIFSAGDSISAVCGGRMVEKIGPKVLGLAGLFCASPLLIKEVKSHCHIPVLDKTTLTSSMIYNHL